MTKSKIFVVEDDEIIARMIVEHLGAWQMDARCARNFQKITEEFTAFAPDLVIMDVKLPYYNGFYWCAEIRRLSKVPIVFLSSADDNMNIVMAMNMGGDDFISKPFDLDVLSAKLQAILRRCYGLELSRHTLTCRKVTLNLDDTTAVYNGCRVELTKNEYLILKLLFEKQGKVVSREELMERLWGNDEFVDDNTLTVNMARIRKKFEALGCEEFVSTRRGLGYLIENE